MKFVFYALIIIALSLLVFYPSFNLALFGDDWLAFYRYIKLLGPNATDHWNYLTYFLTPYGSQDILMGFLQKVYGYESTPYYLTSYLFRIIAAFSFYPLVFYLTKSRLAAFFATLFFSITTIGLDTTNWVFNMPSYITIALFNLFLYFFIKSRDNNKFRLLLISSLLYYLSYVITPIRMHGSLLLILLLEVFWIFQKRNKETIKKAAFRLTVILLIFLIVRYAGHSQGPPEEISQRMSIGITTALTLLSHGRFDFVFYPVVMFGSMFIPDLVLSPIQVDTSAKLLWQLTLPVLVCFLIICLFLLRNLSIPKDRFIKYLAPALILWSAIVTLVYKANLTTMSNYQYIFSLLIGGYIIILVFFLLWHYFKQTYISTALFLSLSWSILSFFFAWWWVPTSIFPTTYRYLIVSAMGVSILLATIIAMGSNRQRRINLILGFSLLLTVHIVATRMYLAQALLSHDQETTKKVWSQIPYIPEIGKNSRPIIFYFEGNATNGGILHDIITFGFPPHMSVLYNITENSKIPLPMDSWEEVVSAVKDGKSFKKHYGVAKDPIPLENVYAFQLAGRDDLVNITNFAREKLRQMMK